MERFGKYENLKKKYVELESCLMGFAKGESKRKGFEVVKAK